MGDKLILSWEVVHPPPLISWQALFKAAALSTLCPSRASALSTRTRDSGSDSDDDSRRRQTRRYFNPTANTESDSDSSDETIQSAGKPTAASPATTAVAAESKEKESPEQLIAKLGWALVPDTVIDIARLMDKINQFSPSQCETLYSHFKETAEKLKKELPWEDNDLYQLVALGNGWVTAVKDNDDLQTYFKNNIQKVDLKMTLGIALAR
jgi:hypothetical protein